MLGDLLRKLVDDRLISAKELEQATGRGASTIYRWMAGQSQPDLGDVEKILKGVESSEARRKLLGHIVRDLPVKTEWLDAASVTDTATTSQAKTDALDMSLKSLQLVADVLRRQRDALRDGRRMGGREYAETVGLIEQAVYHLTLSKNLLASASEPAPAESPSG